MFRQVARKIVQHRNEVLSGTLQSAWQVTVKCSIFPHPDAGVGLLTLRQLVKTRWFGTAIALGSIQTWSKSGTRQSREVKEKYK